MYKYRQAFFENDRERYSAFLEKASLDPSLMHTGILTPYDVVAPIVDRYLLRKGFTRAERQSMDVTWNSLKNFTGSENALAVVDGSGSMYYSYKPLPAAVAQSLGIYFAEHNTGAFKGHFITFSEHPRLVEVKGNDIVEKMQYCMSFNEYGNTDIAAVYNLILKTAVKNRLKQDDMPSRLYIISDMEFDQCAGDSSLTNFEYAKRRYKKFGYDLPQIVFWNVSSRNRQQLVTMNEEGVILVSECTPQIFSMIENDGLDPYSYMMKIISSERYGKIVG